MSDIQGILLDDDATWSVVQRCMRYGHIRLHVDCGGGVKRSPFLLQFHSGWNTLSMICRIVRVMRDWYPAMFYQHGSGYYSYFSYSSLDKVICTYVVLTISISPVL